ncbi:MAG: protein kinase [Sandaracinaceae bacterium]
MGPDDEVEDLATVVADMEAGFRPPQRSPSRDEMIGSARNRATVRPGSQPADHKPQRPPPPPPPNRPPSKGAPGAGPGHAISKRPPSRSSGPRKLPTIGTFGPYAVVGRLAMGGMAEILLAREEESGAGSRHIVVKRILPEYNRDPTFVDMFRDEARVMMRLRHPNVCHVYRFGQVDGTHYIAMEWVQGASLGKLIRQARKEGGIPVAIACHIIASVAEALDHAHAATDEDGNVLNLVHRDVTPDNIMISYDGSVKLLDFGIAKAEARAHQTQAGVVKGKFAYMSPEQCRGKDLDRRTDLFALGVCLYETLTMRPLYRRDTEFETMEAIVRGAVPRLGDRIKNPPEDLDRILVHCLAKKADDRWDSAAALQEALQRFIAKRGRVVSARKVKELMDKLFAEEQSRGPIVDSTPFGSSFHAPSDEQPLFEIASGEMEAFPDDLPLPDLDTAALPSGPSPAAPPVGSLPPAKGTGALPGENVAPGRPGVASPSMRTAQASPASQPGMPSIPKPAGLPSDLAAAGVAGAGTSPMGALPVSRPVAQPVARHPAAPTPARPAPTAPKRVVAPAKVESGSSSGLLLGVGAGLLLLLLVGGGGFYYYRSTLQTGAPTDTVEAPAVLTGILTMASDPAGATLSVDGEPRGETPVTVEGLTTGTHVVTLALEGYAAHEGEVEIRADRTRSILQTLEALPEEGQDETPTEMGRINLTTSPIVRVFHNDEDLGETPLRNLELPVGTVALDLELPDGSRVRRGVLVPADEVRPTHINVQ